MNPDLSTPNVDSSSVAVINTNISYIKQDISEIKAGIKELAGVYATKIAVEDLFKITDARIKKLEDSSNLWKWLSPTLSAIVSGVMVFLVVSFLSK